MEVRNLALLRFDFVLSEDLDDLTDRLDAGFGPAGTDPGTDRTPEAGGRRRYSGDPERLGVGDRFDSLAVDLIDRTPSVVEVRTVATLDPHRFERRRSPRSPEWLAWEADLEGVRSFIPGEALGPETTVWWIDIGPLPDGMKDRPTDLETVTDDLSTATDRDLHEVVEISADRGYLVLDGETMVVPGGTAPSSGRLAGRLVALDLAGNLDEVVTTGGRELQDSWSAVSSLLAIEYWARAMAGRIRGFEDRFDAAVGADVTGGGDYDGTREMLSRLFELEADWAPLETRLGRELRDSRRHVQRVRSEVAESDSRAGAIRDGSGVVAAYLDELTSELESTRLDADRVGERLASVSRLLGTRASLLAARQNLALREATPEPTGVEHPRERLSPWIVAIAGLIALVLAADALMSGGLERFVDRLFEEGLAAFTPQVLAGFGVVLFVFVLAVAARHRAAIVEAVSGRRR